MWTFIISPWTRAASLFVSAVIVAPTGRYDGVGHKDPNGHNAILSVTASLAMIGGMSEQRAPSLFRGVRGRFNERALRERRNEVNRRAVIISNPGETGDEEWLGGVLKDVEHYRAFLLSSIGGLWRRSEVVEMSRPSAAAVRQEVKTLPTYDYVLVIFTGHGWYSTDLESTVLTLRRGQEIDSAELRLATASQTLILDCCRRKHPGMPEVRSLIADMAKAAPAIHPDDCRKYYNRRIRECGSELVVMHACEAGEAAGDDSQKGGVYSYNLLRSSKAWAGTSPVDTSENYAILSVVQAHGATVPLVRQSQTPHIEKPRTGPYYPFCVVA